MTRKGKADVRFPEKGKVQEQVEERLVEKFEFCRNVSFEYFTFSSFKSIFCNI